MLLENFQNALKSLIIFKNGTIRRLFMRIIIFILPIFFSYTTVYAQLPANVLVGYLHNWETLTMASAHSNYNVICLAFAYDPPTNTTGPNMLFTRPPGYATDAAMMADIDLMHSQGKKVLLSIGGATGWVMLNSAGDQTTFENHLVGFQFQAGRRISDTDVDLILVHRWSLTRDGIGDEWYVDLS